MLEVIFRVLIEFIGEILLRVPGRFVLDWFRHQRDDALDDFLTVLCGILFWLIVGLGVWGLVTIVQK